MKYFGTDGIRGIPNQKLTIELVMRIGRAIASLGNKMVIVGTDTRESKDMLAHACIAGALSVGLNVEYVEVIPTPGLIYLSSLYKTVGVMITASHNPYFYNGIKIVNQGKKLSKTEEERIESAIEATMQYTGTVGEYSLAKHLVKEYHRFLFQYIQPTDLKIAIDCANGAVYQTIPLIFDFITNNLVVIHNQPNGSNINADCGSTHLESLTQAVLQHHCDLGFAFDGDGDRVLCVDKNGVLVDGDCIIYSIACYMKDRILLKHNTVALSIMSNLGIIQSLRKKGIEVIETPVGDKYIADALRENDLSIGGESSGHIILSHLSTTGDGILVALELIHILEETSTTIEDWIKDIVLYPDSLQNVVVEHKEKVMGTALLNQIEDIKEELHQDCKIIVRPSGTEDCIRVSVMAKTKELVKQYKERIIQMIHYLDGQQSKKTI